MVERHAQPASRFAGDLGLDESVPTEVCTSYDRWDGRGSPGDLAGEQIPLASRICQLAESVLAGLPPREIEVLRLIARGLSSREIAARLSPSPKTVRIHIEHNYAKTGAGNRAAASLFAAEHGLLPAP